MKLTIHGRSSFKTISIFFEDKDIYRLRFKILKTNGLIFHSQVSYIIPIFGIILGYIFLNEMISSKIVVALIDNNEATLKRIFKRGQQVALQPENSNYKTVIYGPDRIQIQGVLKHLIRSY